MDYRQRSGSPMIYSSNPTHITTHVTFMTDVSIPSDPAATALDGGGVCICVWGWRGGVWVDVRVYGGGQVGDICRLTVICIQIVYKSCI